MVRRTRPKSCPRLIFEVEARDNFSQIEVRAYGATGVQPLLGWVTAERGHEGLDDADDYRVKMAKVNTRLRGCGVGTELYTRLARAVCDEYGQLVSDYTRTDASEMFWRKQVRKKRAVCVTPYGGQRVVFRNEGMFVSGGHWPCGYYKLNCPVRSLAGARRR